MLAIAGSKKNKRNVSGVLTVFAVLLLAGGVYTLSLVSAPALAPIILQKPISVSELPKPTTIDNRIVIPKLGINIAYAKGEASLDRGAQWRRPENGNPADGGNFVIAAHRFSIQPTPQGTIEKSPFYRIDKLMIDDKIIVDYNGTRYAYKIDKIFDVKPSQVEIEEKSQTAKLTLYSCELGGSEAGRIVITASPMGKVAVNNALPDNPSAN